MMRTPDEIKKGLVYCMSRDCAGGKCPYYYAKSCNYEKSNDVLSYNQQLEADNAQLNRCIENMTDKLNALNDELAQLQAERDAAVRDCGCFPCQTCEERENGDLCPMCEINGGYRKFHQWRGVQKEE